MLIYCAIPLIFVFVYSYYEVNHVRFFIWAGVCIIAPVAGKLISGINNYNDFLRVTNNEIEYKNNRKFGIFQLKDVQQIILIRDDRKVLHKIELITVDNNRVIIDLDEMELADFLTSIDKIITARYESLLKEPGLEVNRAH